MKLLLTFSIILFGLQSSYSQFDDVDKVYKRTHSKKDLISFDEFTVFFSLGDNYGAVYRHGSGNKFVFNVYDKDLTYLKGVEVEKEKVGGKWIEVVGFESNENKLVSVICPTIYYKNTNDSYLIILDKNLESNTISLKEYDKQIGEVHASFSEKDNFYFIFYDIKVEDESDKNASFKVIKYDSDGEVSMIDVDLEGESKADLWSYAGHDDEGFYFSDVELVENATKLLITIVKFDFNGEKINDNELEVKNSYSIFAPSSTKSKFLNLNNDYSHVIRENKGNVTYVSYRPHSFAYIYYDNDFNDFILTTNSVGIGKSKTNFKTNENEKGIRITAYDKELKEKFKYEVPSFVTSDANFAKNGYLTPKDYEIDRRSETGFVVKSEGWLNTYYGKADMFYFFDKDGIQVVSKEGRKIFYSKNEEDMKYPISKDSYKDFTIEYVNGQIILINRFKESTEFFRFKKMW